MINYRFVIILYDYHYANFMIVYRIINSIYLLFLSIYYTFIIIVIYLGLKIDQYTN